MLLSAAAALLILLHAGGARGAIGDNSIGINTHIPADDVLDACKGANLQWVRMDNNWVNSQPTSGAPAWFAPLDLAVTHAVSIGLKVFMTIGYTPPWASAGNPDGEPNNDVPRPGLYEVYVRRAVAHYRAMGVTHFGIWNEPNLDSFFEGTLDQYVTLVAIPGIPAVALGCADAGHGDCVAIGPELAHVGDVDVYLEGVLDRLDDAGVHFDIYSHHSYQGFQETGTNVWDGDRYFNVLDQRRFVFTRRSLLDVLRDAGHAPGGVPDREVWMTETGYHNEPPMDAGEQATQATYYMRVIDEQLKRPWYTNTFFYEILDSGDELDGFGIIKRTSGPDGTWSDNFAFKQAYNRLRDRVAAEPAFRVATCGTQCCDGVDNDGDGDTDMADDGCAGSTDDDESDEVVVPAPQLSAIKREGVVVDGALDEWDDAQFIALAAPDDFVSPDHAPTTAADISCRFSAMWDSTHLYLAVEATDDVQKNGQTAEMLWASDSVQAAFDAARNGGHAYDGTDDFELGWARSDGGGVLKYRWAAPPGAPAETSEAAVARAGATTTYEVKIPSSSVGAGFLTEGKEIGFTLLVNDDDGGGREGWIEWTPGIGAFKDPASFGVVKLFGAVLPPPPDETAEPLPDGAPAETPDAGVDGADGGLDAGADGTGDATHEVTGGGCGCSLVA